ALVTRMGWRMPTFAFSGWTGAVDQWNAKARHRRQRRQARAMAKQHPAETRREAEAPPSTASAGPPPVPDQSPPPEATRRSRFDRAKRRP
ncbi:MAG: hypothetical protein AAF514_21825, partial [Verrucomicrobiota bacterium]